MSIRNLTRITKVEYTANSVKLLDRSRVQAASHVDLQQVPLTRYKQYPQEIQAYPIAREPVNVQPMATNNNSALLDLPNVQTDLPTPLIPQQVNQPVTEDRGGMTESTQQSRPSVDMVYQQPNTGIYSEHYKSNATATSV